ncbi:MAG: hypothetical protein HN353_01015 [Bdellovibrionales bacterium]|nr:hypothetical protein [Bdellovibrionales bacterium]MBT3526750.1 hypothetical protein [Bdellovibrionales bacterium]MBT7668593.1 hypothetical protein [Bdellovibrionales bacterium]MBT7768196.1 hypothetical protein [Bdellovibrionales bacterium]
MARVGKSIILPILCLLVLFGCGPRGLQRKSLVLDKSDSNLLGRCSSQHVAGEVIQKIDALFIRSGKYARSFLPPPYANFPHSLTPSYPELVSKSMESPLILNPARLGTYYQRIDSELRHLPPILASYLADGKGELEVVATSVESSNGQQLLPLLGRVYGLHLWAQRYDFALCNRDKQLARSKFDVRSYFKLEHLLQDDDSEEQLLLSAELPVTVEKDLIDLCQKNRPEASVAATAICRRELSQAKWQQFYQHHRKKFYQERYLDIFRLNRTEQLNCRKTSDDKVEIDVPFYLPNIGLQGKLQQAVKRYYSSSKLGVSLKIVLHPSPQGAVTIKEHSGVISHINHQPNGAMEIALSRNLDGEAIISTLGHELGHILGFKDCYLEFLSQGEQQSEEVLVYYSLDKKNLMCSIGKWSLIPDEYLTKLVESRCVF